MSVVTVRDGLRHRVVGREADSRIVLTHCGIRVAWTDRTPDPRSAYQRAVRMDWHTTACGACR